MKIAIVAFDGFNEIDTFLSYTMLNRISEWEVLICSNKPNIESMNGCTIRAQDDLSYANDADVVIFSSGNRTVEMVADPEIITQFTLNQKDQLIGSQCSGVLFLVKLGLIDNLAVSCDKKTQGILAALGIETIDDEPLTAWGNVATCGGCLAGHYLAMWIIWRTFGIDKAAAVIQTVAPSGELHQYTSRTVELFAQAIVGDKYVNMVDSIDQGIH